MEPENDCLGTRRFVLGPGEGQAIWFLRNRMSVKATAGSTGGRSAWSSR